MSKEPVKDRRFATTLARGLKILRAFRSSDDGLGNQEISQRTGIPKSTVSRLTFTLNQLGYLSHSHKHDRYRFGPAALALGNIASASFSFIETASPMMQQLADETKTLVIFSVRDDTKMLLTKTWRPATADALWLEVGHRIPIIGSSSGLAYLASLSEAEFSHIQEHLPPKDPALGKERLAENRQDAYGQLLSHGFVTPDLAQRYAKTVNAVSVGFRTKEFSEPLAITCGATPEILSPERISEEVGPLLRTKVRELEAALGIAPALVQRG